MTASYNTTNDIAIIGISFRLPRADTIQQLADLLDSGLDCTSELPETRRKDVPTKKINHFAKFPIGSYLDEIDRFDYKFFKISPKEASLMDPNQRVFLETAWLAFEDAGYTEKQLIGSNTGIFVGFKGTQGTEYLNYIAEVDSSLLPLATIGNKPALMTGRLSYLYDLKGPNMLIDTTCSSSLVAVHQACQSLRNAECDTALVGGIKLLTNLKYSEDIGVTSKDGKTRSFDNEADGTGFGEGVIAILLKPLQRAIDDHDRVYAVIKGSAVNHDGTSIGLTAPNANSQADVIVKSWENANISPETISYIEAHGTGTRLGDPIEIDGIKKAFNKYTKQERICGISSIKSNIGHLDTAAGLAGLLSSVVALNYKKRFPVVHFKNLNENIVLNNSPVYISNQTETWESPDGSPRRCGVSSFGLSGTNCHVVLEEFIEKGQKENIDSSGNAEKIFTVSAKTKTSLQEYLRAYKTYLEEAPEIRLHDLCFAANTRRTHFQYRLAIIVNNRMELVDKLNRLIETDVTKFAELTDENIYYGEKRRQIKWKNGADFDANELCLRYSQGYEIEWAELYNANGSPISIPKYPFERNRCWVNKPVADILYRMTWDKKPLIKFRSASKDHYLLITDCEGFAERFTTLHSSDFVQTLLIGDRENELDYESLFEQMNTSHVILALNVASDESNDSQNDALRLHHIVRTLCRITNEALSIQLITSNANSITGQERIRPHNAALLGYGKVIAQENRNTRIKLIDIDDAADISQLYMELINFNEDTMASYRDGVRYVPSIEKIDAIPVQPEKANSWTIPGKVYVITGGLGGIGLEISRYFAQHQAKIMLLGRSPFIDKADWHRTIDDPSVGTKIQETIRKLLDIEKLGATVDYLQVDVANEQDLDMTLSIIRSTYGSIDGVIHSAGVAGDGFIFSKTDEKFNNVLSSKMNGTRHLDKLTCDDELDFFIMFSSATTLVGAPGQSDYTAANSYVDSYSAYRRQNGKPAITINWAAWREVGMAVDYKVTGDGKFYPLGTEDALKSFEQILLMNVDRVIVGEPNQDRVSFNRSKISLNELYRENYINIINSLNAVDSEPLLDESGRELNEEILIALWEELLGVKGVTADSDFFDLGGHSVLAVRLEIELEKRQLIGSNSNIAMAIHETSVLKDLLDYINGL